MTTDPATTRSGGLNGEWHRFTPDADGRCKVYTRRTSGFSVRCMAEEDHMFHIKEVPDVEMNPERFKRLPAFARSYIEGLQQALSEETTRADELHAAADAVMRMKYPCACYGPGCPHEALIKALRWFPAND